MSLEHYLYGPSEAGDSLFVPDDLMSYVDSLSGRLLERLDALPPNLPPPETLPDDWGHSSSLVADHWGVYGVGVVGPPPDGQDTTFRAALAVDPAWLYRDLRDTNAREPRILARDAVWARDVLQQLLGIRLSDESVLLALLPPTRFAASGDRSHFPSVAGATATGLLGPPVTYTANGATEIGFLTAGHAAPQDELTVPGTTVDVDDAAGNVCTGPVRITRVPSGFGSGVGHAATAMLDAAIVFVGPPPTTSIGSAGGAAFRSTVQRVVGAVPGTVTGYLKWVGSSTSVWRDCYAVAASTGDFCDPGDSGSAVLANGEVIGIVVGGSPCVPGCRDSLTLVQDISIICSELGCSVL